AVLVVNLLPPTQLPSQSPKPLLPNQPRSQPLNLLLPNQLPNQLPSQSLKPLLPNQPRSQPLKPLLSNRLPSQPLNLRLLNQP
ncbi:hypothetical protein BMH52_12595, partial [Pseudomonas sp. BTN1]